MGFRAFCQRCANRIGLGGWTRNIPGMTVEVVAEGTEAQLSELLVALHEGPPLAEVHQLENEFDTSTGEFEAFVIREDGTRADARALRAHFPRSIES